MKKFFLLPVAALLSLAACNKDGVITRDNAPVIELDSETGVYAVKTGKELTINPSYLYVDDSAAYSWICGGSVISDKPSLTYIFDEGDTYYITVRVETSAGEDETDIRVEVSDLAPPFISLAVPAGGLDIPAGREYEFAPEILNGEGAEYEWTLDGDTVGTDSGYTLPGQKVGTYTLLLRVRNGDGEASKEIKINVVESLPAEAVIVGPSFYGENRVRNVALGRTLFLRPHVTIPEGAEAQYRWSVDGEAVDGADEPMFAFTPGATGNYTLTFTLTCGNAVSLDITVKCCEPADKRPYKTGCSLAAGKVYEFVPAPGQFVNETQTGGYGGESTHAAAIAYAEKRLAEKRFVSLGGWGGYIVVGFDHSIENKGGYDFSIAGNQSESSSEPGVVCVMQDTNGNGLPDDEWYELKGSEYGQPETVQYYAVTYYRPGPKMNTQWTDNTGNSGTVDYLEVYHAQDFYYPAWIENDSYTLYGPRLKERTIRNSANGNWSHEPFGWGYADNMGGDMKADPAANYFKISDAVNPDGTPAGLAHIDFVKVQTAVSAKAGWTGENSTEVAGFRDENNK